MERSRDYAFAFQLLYEDGISVIPSSPFYSPEDKDIGQRYVRLTFDKC